MSRRLSSFIAFYYSDSHEKSTSFRNNSNIDAAIIAKEIMKIL